MLEDDATCGLAWIHSRGRAEGHAVFLSGQGGDEILDARRDWPGYQFPERLEPWPDFFGGFQAAYLTKEEFVAGVFLSASLGVFVLLRAHGARAQLALGLYLLSLGNQLCAHADLRGFD